VPEQGWDTFEHSADVGIRGWGPSLEQSFAQAACALSSLLVVNWQLAEPETWIDIQAESYDLDGLFVAWINELVAQFDIQGQVFCLFEPRIQGNLLQARVCGQSLLDRDWELGLEVKGATFAELFVGKVQGLWLAQCIVDV
jgi:SHS2 domain-containing protein